MEHKFRFELNLLFTPNNISSIEDTQEFWFTPSNFESKQEAWTAMRKWFDQMFERSHEIEKELEGE